MKRILVIIALIGISVALKAQIKPFTFIHISDTHIGSPDGRAEEDLRRTVQDINEMNQKLIDSTGEGIAFIIITGDITELGTNAELRRAKALFDSLKVKWYIIPGNHDSGWSESGGVSFITTFGYDKFWFDYNGIRFIGCASGPYVRMSDGHIPRDAIVWLDELLKKTPKDQPIIFANHYPIDNALDNWYEITDRLNTRNTLAIICGHGHTNKALNFEGIPAVMGRSNLRAKQPIGGYNIVRVNADSITYRERRPLTETLPVWTRVYLKDVRIQPDTQVARPDYSINDKYPAVRSEWIYSSDANIISTPAVAKDLAFVGNQNGKMLAISMKTGRLRWSYKTEGGIFSSPAVSGDKLVFGSGDGNIYCLSTDAKLLWKKKAEASVLGSPLINGDTVFIGASDHSFYALNINTGNTIWQYSGLNGPVVSTPLLYNGMVIFGAWDRNLYAVSSTTGNQVWKWSNGSAVINFSPASCIPVANDNVVYVVAPDRNISAIDATTGTTLWRNRGGERESIGISGDGKFVYGKTMQDTIVAYATSREPQQPAWKMHVGFGYEHVPSMLIEKDNLVYFGTKNGVVYCIDPLNRTVIWAHKIDNSMVNTVKVIDKRHLIVSTMDGKVAFLAIRQK